MAAINPRTILKQLEKVKGVYQTVAPKTTDKPEGTFLKLDKDLKALRGLATKEKNDTNKSDFDTKKAETVKFFRGYNTDLKGFKTKDPNQVRLAAYQKALAKLLKGLLELEFATLDDTEQTLDLSRLPDVDPSVLDNAPDQPPPQRTDPPIIGRNRSGGTTPPPRPTTPPTITPTTTAPKDPPIIGRNRSGATTTPPQQTNGGTTQTPPQQPLGGTPKRQPPPVPPPSPGMLKSREETARNEATTARDSLDAKLKEIEALTGRIDRRMKLGQQSGKVNDNAWALQQMTLEAKLVELKRAAKALEETATTKETDADDLKAQRDKMLDNRIHGMVPPTTAQHLQTLDGEINLAKTNVDKAQELAEHAHGELVAVLLPEQTKKKLEDAERKVTNLKRLIHDEKGRIILPGTAKSKRRDAAVKEYEDELVKAEKALKTAESNHQQATAKATFIVGTETKLRTKDANTRVDASSVAIELRKKEVELAGERLQATVKQREVLKGNLDKAIANIPGATKLTQDAALAETAVNDKRKELADKTEKYNLLANVASGAMVEPALQDAKAEVKAKQLELDRLAAIAEKEAKYLKEAQDGGLSQDKILAFQKAFDEADAARKEQETALNAAKADEATLAKLARGDGPAITSAKQARDRAAKEVERLEGVLKTAKSKPHTADQLKPFEEALAKAQAALAKQERFVGAGERGAAIVGVGLPAKRDKRKNAENIRNEAQTNLETNNKAIADILAKGKLDDKFDKQDKKAIKEAADNLHEKQQHTATAKEFVTSFEDQIADAGPNPPQALKDKLAQAKNALKLAKQQEEAAVTTFTQADKAARDKAEKKLSKEDQAALNTARTNVTQTENAIKVCDKEIDDVDKEIADLSDQVAATQKQEMDNAKQALTTADKNAQDLSDQFDTMLKGSPEATQALSALDQVDGTLERDQEAQAKALTDMASAESDSIIAGFQLEALENVTVEKKAFEFFKDVSAADFEEALRKGVNNSKIGKMFPALPVRPSKMNPQEKAAFELEYNKILKLRAEYTEYLRQAQEAMDRLVERDQILDEAGATFEERKAAFAHVPEQFLPPKFKEELKAYREVDALFKEEDEEERIKEANKAQAKDTILSALGDLAAVAGPLVDIFLDAMDVAGNLTGFQSNNQNASFLGPIQDQTGNFSIASSVANGISALLSNKDMIESEDEAIEGLGGPQDQEAAQRRKLLDESKKLKVLSFLKEFIMTDAKMVYGALNLATNITNTTLQAVPILNTVISGIESGIEIGKAGMVITRAARETMLYKQTKGDNEDEALASSMRNQSRRSANRATKQSIHAASKVTYTVGTGLMIGGGGYGSAVGAVLTGAGKGLEYGNKAAFQCIDWGLAAQAEKTLQLARAGSQQAMQEIFKDHQKYATMYICLKAKRGDARSLKFCQLRGLDRQAVLDSATSLKLIRQEMLNVVEQKDKMNTLKEDAGETWDKICKAGKVLGGALKTGADFVTGGSVSALGELISDGAKALKDKISPPKPVPTVESMMNRPDPQHFMQLSLRGESLKAKVTGGEDITEKDVADRNRIVMQMETLQKEVARYNNDWPEPNLQNQGGQPAGVRIKEVLDLFKTLPDRPTVVRHSGKEETRQTENRKTAQTTGS
jgi:hypothetical protein